MKRKLIIMFTIVVVIFCMLDVTNQFPNVHANNTENQKPNSTSVQDLELKDDAFHGTHNYISMEWWYFDAILNDDYALHAGFKIYSIRKVGIVYPILEIYKGRELLCRKTQPYELDSLSASTSYPSVKVAGQSIIELDTQEFNTTGTWKYSVSIQIENQGVNLTFTGTTTGWKYTILEKEEWAVILPKADVFGTITVDGETINVTGRGYHDHNWNFTIGTKVREWGWYWGRVTGDRYTLIFAWFIKSPFKFDNLVILNKDDDGFIEIDPKDIHLSFANYTWKYGMRIPSHIQISVENTSVKVDVLMNTVSIHLLGYPLVHYWRYFVNVNGFVSLDDDVEDFNDSLQMFEIMRF